MADLTQYPHAMYEDPATGKAMPQNAATIIGSKIKVPVEIQGRLTQTVTTHNAVSIAASGNSYGSFINCDGYDKIYLHLLNDAATGSVGSVDWSNDGVALLTTDTAVIASNTTQKKNGVTDVKAPFFRLVIGNTDAALAHTVTATAYLR